MRTACLWSADLLVQLITLHLGPKSQDSCSSERRLGSCPRLVGGCCLLLLLFYWVEGEAKSPEAMHSPQSHLLLPSTVVIRTLWHCATWKSHVKRGELS